MGAETLYKTFDGQLNPEQLKKYVIEHIENERGALRQSRDYEGYSGTWGELAPSCTAHKDIFETKEAARDFLDGKTQKWEGAEAVRFKESPRFTREESQKFEEDKKSAFSSHKKLLRAEELFQTSLDKFEKASKEIAEIKDEMNKSHSTKEAAFHKCPECKSSVADKYVSKTNGPVGVMSIRDARMYKNIESFMERYQSSAIPACPLCKTALFGETVKKRLNKKLENIFDLCAETNLASEKIIALRKEIEDGLLAKLKRDTTLAWLVCGVASC